MQREMQEMPAGVAGARRARQGCWHRVGGGRSFWEGSHGERVCPRELVVLLQTHALGMLCMLLCPAKCYPPAACLCSQLHLSCFSSHHL